MRQARLLLSVLLKKVCSARTKAQEWVQEWHSWEFCLMVRFLSENSSTGTLSFYFIFLNALSHVEWLSEVADSWRLVKYNQLFCLQIEWKFQQVRVPVTFSSINWTEPLYKNLAEKITICKAYRALLFKNSEACYKGLKTRNVYEVREVFSYMLCV